MRVGVYAGEALAETGGGFTIVQEIAKVVARRGPRSRHTFALLTSAKQAGGHPNYEGMEVIPLGAAVHDRSVLTRVQGRVTRELARLRRGAPPATPDVPYIPAVDALLTKARIDVVWYLSAWECLSLEIPFFTVVWDLQHRLQPFFPEVSQAGAWAFRERWMSAVLRRAAMVVAGNEVGRDEIERFYDVPRERIRLLPHPTPEVPAPAPGDRRSQLIPGEYLFYPAQFWPHKNHVNLLLALQLLRERDGLDLSLALTGSDKGNLSFIRQTAAELGLAQKVRFLGFVSGPDLAALYRDAVALTYVTFFGPENLPTLEAFASGCPVIASDVPGARHQLGDAALLVDPTKPEEIAAAVARVYREPGLRDRLIQAGAARARLNTPANFVSGIEQWLDEFEGVRRCWPTGVPGSVEG